MDTSGVAVDVAGTVVLVAVDGAGVAVDAAITAVDVAATGVAMVGEATAVAPPAADVSAVGVAEGDGTAAPASGELEAVGAPAVGVTVAARVVRFERRRTNDSASVSPSYWRGGETSTAN